MKASLDNRDDPDLVDAANSGQREAFETLYARYRDWVYSRAYRICANEQDSCDVVQETFFYFFNKFPGFVLYCKVTTFLYPVVRHLALAKRRKDSKFVQLDDEQIEQLPAPEIPDDVKQRADLAEMVTALPEWQREVILLRFADGMDLQEISQALQIPVGTVKSRLHNALSALRKYTT